MSESIFTLALPDFPVSPGLVKDSKEAENLLKEAGLKFRVHRYGDALEPRLFVTHGSNIPHAVYIGLIGIQEFVKFFKEKNQQQD